MEAGDGDNSEGVGEAAVAAGPSSLEADFAMALVPFRSCRSGAAHGRCRASFVPNLRPCENLQSEFRSSPTVTDVGHPWCYAATNVVVFVRKRRLQPSSKQRGPSQSTGVSDGQRGLFRGSLAQPHAVHVAIVENLSKLVLASVLVGCVLDGFCGFQDAAVSRSEASLSSAVLTRPSAVVSPCRRLLLCLLRVLRAELLLLCLSRAMARSTQPLPLPSRPAPLRLPPLLLRRSRAQASLSCQA